MSEKRNCQFCTVPGNKECYMEMAKKINMAVNELPDPPPELSEEDKKDHGRNMGLIINKEISNLEEEAKKNFCRNNNRITTDNKWDKYL